MIDDFNKFKERINNFENIDFDNHLLKDNLKFIDKPTGFWGRLIYRLQGSSLRKTTEAIKVLNLNLMAHRGNMFKNTDTNELNVMVDNLVSLDIKLKQQINKKRIFIGSVQNLKNQENLFEFWLRSLPGADVKLTKALIENRLIDNGELDSYNSDDVGSEDGTSTRYTGSDSDSADADFDIGDDDSDNDKNL